MPGPALSFAMTLSQKLTPKTMRGILIQATESSSGTEFERLVQLPSWGNTFNIAWAGTTALGASMMDPRQANKALRNRQQFINEIMNDEDLPRFIEQNKSLMSCIISHMLAANAGEAKHPSRQISAFVEELPVLVSQLQKRKCLENVTDLNEMVLTTFDTLINDAASVSTEKDKPNLFNASLEVSEKFLEMTAAHPVVARNVIGRIATSTKSPSHQEEVLKVLPTLALEKGTKTKKGPDGKSRKDLATACTQYRDKAKKTERMLLDTPTEATIHNHDFSDLELGPNTIAQNLNIEKFTFKEAKIMRGFPPANSCFANCDFQFAFLEDNVSFKDCVMDTDTFGTLLPSLRVAKAEGKNINLAGMTLVGDVSELDLSHIETKGIKHVVNSKTKALQPVMKPDALPLSTREIINRKAIANFSNTVWLSLSAQVKQELIQATPSESPLPWVDLDFGRPARARKQFATNLEAMYGTISTLEPLEQATITHTLTKNPTVAKNFAKTLNEGEEGKAAFQACIAEIRETPEFQREYLRTTKQPELDPFTNEFLTHMHSLSEVERQVLITLTQENVALFSKVYDNAPGTPPEKAAALFREIKTAPQYKFRKEVREYNPKSPYFEPHHVESMRTLFIEIGCGAFLDTVEYESARKNPPTMFGTAFQKTLCFLFPNLRNLFGANTKFGKTLASRSFLQLCKIAVYSITHPQKMAKTLKDSAYVMDQIGWITWKEPRDVAAAQQELVTKLVTQDIAGDFLQNQRLPSLAVSVTDLFRDKDHAAQTIAVGQKFYHAMNETGVVRNFDRLIKGPQTARNKILAPFLGKVINDNLLKEVNPETVAFLADSMNKILTTQGRSVVMETDIEVLVKTGTTIANLLKKHKISDQIETLLLASNTERLETLKRTIHDPKDLADIIRNIEEMQKATKPIMRKAALEWSRRKEAKAEVGTTLWYEPDQAKLEKVMAPKQTNPDATTDLNTEFNACSFGNIRVIGTEESPASWKNVKAQKFDMWGATLTHVNFDGAQLTGYTNPVTNKWYFRGASFDHAKMDHCTLNNTKLKHAYMQDVQMFKCQATNLELTHSDMQYATLQQSELSKTSFRNSNLYGSYVVNCDLTDTDFSNTKCEHAVFNSRFRGDTNFEGAFLEHATFAGSVFNGNVSFRRATLGNVNFDNVRFTPDATIDLEGAIITESLLEKLKKEYPKQLRNTEDLKPIPDMVLQGMGKAEQSKTKADSLSALISERGKKRFKGII